MKRLNLLVIVFLVVLIPGKVLADGNEKKPQEYVASRTIVTTDTFWVSENVDERQWVIDKEGTPGEVWVIDVPYQPLISHVEIIHHEAVTHQEKVYATRTKYTIVHYRWDDGEQMITIRYDLTKKQLAALLETLNDPMYETSKERYLKETVTVVDQEAWDEEITVIDQEEVQEVGHYETGIIGEIGHWEPKEGTVIGDKSGSFEIHVKTVTETYEE